MGCPARDSRLDLGVHERTNEVLHPECVVELRRMANSSPLLPPYTIFSGVACRRRSAYFPLPEPKRRSLNAKASNADQMIGLDGLSFTEYPLRLLPKRWDC